MASLLLSPEARHRAATLPLLLDQDDMGAVRKRKAESTTTTASTSSKKNTVVQLQVVLLSTLLMCAGLITVVCHHKTSSRKPLPLDPPEPPYAAETEREIEWDSIAASIAGRPAASRVALLNFSPAEVKRWILMSSSTTTASVVRAVRLRPADSTVTWDALYPEWIDEDSTSRCPSLPDPDTPPGQHFDLVAVKLPCRNTTSWSRDVARLHLQLSAAKLAVLSPSAASEVLIVSDCLPLPNLFPCKHLLRRHGHTWLYSPDVTYLRHRIRLPVGSCDLAVHPYPTGTASSNCKDADDESRARQREAYATVLHSSGAYVCGAIAVAQSIRQTGSRRDLVALVDESISGEQRAGLEAAGWQVRAMERIRNPRAVPGSYNEWNYSKFRLWQLTEYDKVVFVDADQVVLRNIDFLFEAAAEVSATGNSGALFNSGVMVVEPCNCTFELLMSRVDDIRSYNGGDQGYLNEVFTWWHRLPRRVNVLKYYRRRERDLHAGALTTSEAYVVHYLGIKPWRCFRDYDCNWNVPLLRRFASDEAHARWWAVHDRITPEELATRFCALPARQRAALEHERRQAEMANATDMHWSRAITDPRNKQQLPPTTA